VRAVVFTIRFMGNKWLEFDIFSTAKKAEVKEKV